MRNKAHIQATVISFQPPAHIFAAETVSYTSEFPDAKFIACILDGTVDDRFDSGLRVVFSPFGKVKSLFLLFDAHWIASEQVRDKD